MRLFWSLGMLDTQKAEKSPYLAHSPLSTPGIKPCQRLVETIRALIDSRVEYVYPLLTYVELVSVRVANKNPVALLIVLVIMDCVPFLRFETISRVTLVPVTF